MPAKIDFRQHDVRFFHRPITAAGPLKKSRHGTPVLEVEVTDLRKYAKLTNFIDSTPFDQMLAMRLENLPYEAMITHQPIGSQLLAYLVASRATLEKKRKPRFVNLENRGPVHTSWLLTSICATWHTPPSHLI